MNRKNREYTSRCLISRRRGLIWRRSRCDGKYVTFVRTAVCMAVRLFCKKEKAR